MTSARFQAGFMTFKSLEQLTQLVAIGLSN